MTGRRFSGSLRLTCYRGRVRMENILQDLSSPHLPEAILANHAACVAPLGRSPKADLYDGPDLLRVLTGIPHPVFNAVFRARFSPGALDEQIESALAPFKARGLPMFWWVGPDGEP